MGAVLRSLRPTRIHSSIHTEEEAGEEHTEREEEEGDWKKYHLELD